MNIKRARGHRLYTEENQKILDLSMDYGRAVLGHRPNGLSLSLKNSIERGIYASYDSKFTGRLRSYLNSKFPEYPYSTLLESESSLGSIDILDPLFNKGKGDYGYWRPFLNTPDYENLIILYPMPGLNSSVVMVSRSKPAIDSHDISPVIVGGILRSMYDYDAALKKFNPESYDIYKDLKTFNVIPPYLIYIGDGNNYNELCCSALDQGVLLNRKSPVNILATDYSSGEVKKIVQVLGS